MRWFSWDLAIANTLVRAESRGVAPVTTAGAQKAQNAQKDADRSVH